MPPTAAASWPLFQRPACDFASVWTGSGLGTDCSSRLPRGRTPSTSTAPTAIAFLCFSCTLRSPLPSLLHTVTICIPPPDLLHAALVTAGDAPCLPSSRRAVGAACAVSAGLSIAGLCVFALDSRQAVLDRAAFAPATLAFGRAEQVCQLALFLTQAVGLLLAAGGAFIIPHRRVLWRMAVAVLVVWETVFFLLAVLLVSGSSPLNHGPTLPFAEWLTLNQSSSVSGVDGIGGDSLTATLRAGSGASSFPNDFPDNSYPGCLYNVTDGMLLVSSSGCEFNFTTLSIVLLHTGFVEGELSVSEQLLLSWVLVTTAASCNFIMQVGTCGRERHRGGGDDVFCILCVAQLLLGCDLCLRTTDGRARACACLTKKLCPFGLPPSPATD
jgi:hypothetical protein